MFPALAVILICAIPSGCFFPGAIDDIDVKQLESMIRKEKTLVIVDNRTELEYSSGHIPGAVHIPQEGFPMIASLLPADKNTPLVFYCRGSS